MKTLSLISGLLAFIISIPQAAMSQRTEGFDFSANWTYGDLARIASVDTAELNWLEKNISADFAHQTLKLVSHLTMPSACQLLPAYAVYDGSYRNPATRNLWDSLLIRCPDGDAGVVHTACLIARIRKKYIYDDAVFGEKPLKLTGHGPVPANNLQLSFDFGPADTILTILSSPGLSYESIYQRIATHPFDAMIEHRNQSFYTFPFTREKLGQCLLLAAGNHTLDSLYRLMNPNGLLHFAGVREHYKNYREIMDTLAANESFVLDLIKARLLPYMPDQAMVNRKVTFFFGQGADGWALGDIAGIDLEYYKDDYQTMLDVLQHETYHSVQDAVKVLSKSNSKEFMPYQHLLNYIFLEGTATFVADPNRKTTDQYEQASKLGVILFEQATKAFRDGKTVEMNQLKDKGIQSAGPFYSMGKKMTEEILAGFGPERIKKILPLGGIVFFKTYFDAIQKKGVKSIFDASIEKFIRSLPNDYDGES
ncbi:MAG TPA: DUF5700 domain-containing putative Zn-dependent protease [Puia sp.]